MRSIKCVVIGDGAVGKTSLLISYTTNTFPTDYVPTVFDNYTTTLALQPPIPLSNNPTNTSSSTTTGGASSVFVDQNTPVFKHSNSSRRKPLAEGDTLSSSTSSFSTGGTDSNGALKRQIFRLNLWDTAGQEEYDRLRPLSYRQTDIFLICFSVSEPTSFKNVIDKWFQELKRVSGIESSDLYLNYKKYPILLVGTKSDLRDDESEIQKLRDQNQQFVSKEEIDKIVKDNGFMGYCECSAATQNGVRQVFEKAVQIVAYEPDKLQRAKCQEENKKMAIEENVATNNVSSPSGTAPNMHSRKDQKHVSNNPAFNIDEKTSTKKERVHSRSQESSERSKKTFTGSSHTKSEKHTYKKQDSKKKLKKKSGKCVIV
ncbi:hypothetical protein RNJ44_04338 [Nakaseomyces bracarensis]|uniref:Uncharacterized protein n=1 Tax=Nakaseomyces bracarensis TaxID=273131 RepID=A0ABR4NUN8_9SACH